MSSNSIRKALEDIKTNPDYKRILRVLLKYEIQLLLQRLSDTGEESVVITASVSDGTLSQLGSSRGERFLTKLGTGSQSLGDLKADFIKYCLAGGDIENSAATQDYGLSPVQRQPDPPSPEPWYQTSQAAISEDWHRPDKRPAPSHRRHSDSGGSSRPKRQRPDTGAISDNLVFQEIPNPLLAIEDDEQFVEIQQEFSNQFTSMNRNRPKVSREQNKTFNKPQGNPGKPHPVQAFRAGTRPFKPGPQRTITEPGIDNTGAAGHSVPFNTGNVSPIALSSNTVTKLPAQPVQFDFAQNQRPSLSSVMSDTDTPSQMNTDLISIKLEPGFELDEGEDSGSMELPVGQVSSVKEEVQSGFGAIGDPMTSGSMAGQNVMNPNQSANYNTSGEQGFAGGLAAVTPGVIDPAEAQLYNMPELVPGMGVFLHQTQYHEALRKCQQPTRKENTSGQTAARYLMQVFFTKQQLIHGTLSDDPEPGLEKLDKRITDAILGFSVINSSTRSGQINHAIYCLISSLRCKEKKKTASKCSQPDPK